MALGVDLSILNQRGTPAFFSDIFANRPAFGFAGRVFISTDTGAIYEDTGTAWTLIADAGAGTTGTLEQVTTNGKTTTKGISITGSTLNFDASGVSANPITMIYDTSINRLLTPVVRLYGTGTISTNYVELFGTNATQNRTVQFPDASGTVGLSSAALTAGSVVFAGTGGILSQDNTNFFWDNTNKYLGLGNTGIPTAPLDIHNGTIGQLIQLNATSTNNSNIGFLNGGVGKWRIGNVYNAGANDFNVYNIGLAANALSINSTTNNATFNGGIRTTGTADQQLWVYGTSPSLRLYSDLSATPSIIGFVGMASVANNFIQTSVSGDMCIGTNTTGRILLGTGTTTVNPLATILPSGNFGIGTSSPTQLLTVAGSVAVGGQKAFWLRDDDGFSSNASRRAWAITANYAVFGTFSIYGASAVDSNPLSGTAFFNIANTGNVLIGTTTDAGQKLQVNGTVKNLASFTNNGTVSVPTATATTLYTITTYGLYTFYVDLLNGIGAPVNYSAYAIICFDSATARILQQTNGTNLLLTLSGNSLQVTQTSGISQNIRYVFQLIST